MVGKLDVVPVGVNQFSTLALSGFRVFHLAQLAEGIPTGFVVVPLVQEHIPIVTDKLPYTGDTKDAVERSEQAVHHIRVIFHAQLKVFDDGVD